jgi:hypothetical protein
VVTIHLYSTLRRLCTRDVPVLRLQTAVMHSGPTRHDLLPFRVTLPQFLTRIKFVIFKTIFSNMNRNFNAANT